MGLKPSKSDVPSSGLEGTVKDVQEALPRIEEGKEPENDRPKESDSKSDAGSQDPSKHEQAPTDAESEPSTESVTTKPRSEEELDRKAASPQNKRKRSSSDGEGVENCACQGCSCQPCQCDPCRCDNTLQIQELDEDKATNHDSKDSQVNGEQPSDTVFDACQCQDCPCVKGGGSCGCKEGGECTCKAPVEAKNSCQCGCKDGQECKCSPCPESNADQQAQCPCANRDCKATDCTCGCLRNENQENENPVENNAPDKENHVGPESPSSPKLLIDEDGLQEAPVTNEIVSQE